jgi:asparagine synthase (glutamine-hydrolysing)
MFALALWDRNKKTLWLARDRLGVKPLFYYLDDRQLVFGSEIKSILQATDIDRNLNWQSFGDFLSMNFVPQPDTPFRRIKALLPGHYILHNGHGLKITQYWNLQFRHREKCTEVEQL